MTFKSEMQAMAAELIETVFGSEGDVSRPVTLMNPTLAGYDPVVDQEITGIEDSLIIVGLLGPFVARTSQTLTSDDVAFADHRLKVAYTSLGTFEVKPKTTTVRDGSDVYLVIDSRTDTAQAVTTLILKRIN